MTGPDDPTIARTEVERLKLHELKLTLAVAKQMEVDLDITNATKDVSVKTDCCTSYMLAGHWPQSTAPDQ